MPKRKTVDACFVSQFPEKLRSSAPQQQIRPPDSLLSVVDAPAKISAVCAART